MKQSEPFVMCLETFLNTENVPAAMKIFGLKLVAQWRAQGNPKILQVKARELAERFKITRVYVMQCLATLERQGYITRGFRSSEGLTLSLLPPLVGYSKPSPSTFAVSVPIGVMSSSPELGKRSNVDFSTLRDYSNKLRLPENLLETLQRLLFESKFDSISTQEALNVLESYSLKVSREAIKYPGAYLRRAFSNVLNERKQSPAAFSQRTEKIVSANEALCKELNEGDLVEPARVPQNLLTGWLNDGILQFEDQYLKKNNGYIFALDKANLIHAYPAELFRKVPLGPTTLQKALETLIPKTLENVSEAV